MKIIFTSIKNIIHFSVHWLHQRKAFFLPGMIVFAVLFLAGNVMNFSLSYMGNTNEAVAMQIIRLFWWKILFQVLKVLLVYLVTGAVLGAVFVAAFARLKERFRFFPGRLSVSLAAAGALLLCVFFFFSFRLIVNPQMYMENFSAHAAAFRNYQDFLVDHVHPYVPGAIAWIMIVAALATEIALGGYVSRLGTMMSRFRWSRGTIIMLTALTVFLTAGVLYEAKLIFYRQRPLSPNILILSSDAVRPDHLSANGYERATTPNLDRLVKESLQYRGVMSALPRTFPAWVSMLTSRYPLTHEIRHMFPRSRERNVPFDSAAGVLSEKGYRTAVISDFAGDIFPRIDLGFDRVRALTFSFDTLLVHMILEKQTFLLPFITNRLGDLVFPEMRGIAKHSHHEAVTDETIGEIESSRGEPFFITVFYSATHFPYSVPWPYYGKYADPDYRGPYRYYKQVVIQMDAGGSSAPAEDTEADRR
ncbi:MAG: sulfatase-like hydrolase/transferase, partial [Spirochaetes bacterium]|nr:sulfatase-like hydrolase/transferase [Spirochaetota bacterium]